MSPGKELGRCEPSLPGSSRCPALALLVREAVKAGAGAPCPPLPRRKRGPWRGSLSAWGDRPGTEAEGPRVRDGGTGGGLRRETALLGFASATGRRKGRHRHIAVSVMPHVFSDRVTNGQDGDSHVCWCLLQPL